MEKSRDAFRTISEVAGWLDVPTHVLRFWESRFSQIKPVKRAGGRRYYRPSDMSLIGGIKTLLHDQGMTIRGVQKMLREQGIKHVSSFSPPLHKDDAPDGDDTIIEGTAIAIEPEQRPVSIPASAARSTRDAEPAPQGTAPNPSKPDEDDAQPDMFPEPDPEETTTAPIFAHRSARAPAGAAPETAPTPSIPETPDVPDTDPDDDVPSYEVATRPIVALLRLSPADFSGRKDELTAVIGRLRDLRERMSG